MYRVGHVMKHHYRVAGLLGVLGLALLVGGVFAGHQIFQADTRLTQSAVRIGTVPATSTPTQHVAERVFALDVPSAWHMVAPPNIPATGYSWVGTGVDSARRLDVFVDALPAGFAVNRLLPVASDGDRVATVGAVSDNCVNFTNKAVATPGTGVVPAKWSGISFLCDVGNYERDVVGTGSIDGINTVGVSGHATGVHHVFFVYTDNSASPDYTVFERIVKSFQAL